jgi:hypothetical protein
MEEIQKDLKALLDEVEEELGVEVKLIEKGKVLPRVLRVRSSDLSHLFDCFLVPVLGQGNNSIYTRSELKDVIEAAHLRAKKYEELGSATQNIRLKHERFDADYAFEIKDWARRGYVFWQFMPNPK